MADFQLDDLPTYMIWRSEPLDDSFDLTTGLNFFPTKGSAELDEALQFWFLLSQTPQVRRRDAVIAFLNEEKDNSSSEASGPLSSTELDNGTQTSTSASTGFHSYDTGPHQSPPTDIIYGPIDECVNHHLPPPAPLEGNVEAHFMNMVRIIRRISARIYGTPSEALPLLESPDYHTSMGAPPSGSTEQHDSYRMATNVNTATVSRPSTAPATYVTIPENTSHRTNAPSFVLTVASDSSGKRTSQGITAKCTRGWVNTLTLGHRDALTSAAIVAQGSLVCQTWYDTTNASIIGVLFVSTTT
ncbi:hypothetical protein M409DRAFT_17404 [Zasmidium cellare ATCC 36951]|uniref:Uncharacterized protein n=1 Tax=Zasmidium cellare ATCC 36951 TaxID=1080233 RepID=A0A6A6CYA2_ZASCE|nr:uncharacterized protein M409DRAFT_17404 [Zasmidium cellare ATCC 36951]KAF2172164.1 hypothetical protein M409DRAFT_17404 [Zasmidium cellare ATCC 36951]